MCFLAQSATCCHSLSHDFAQEKRIIISATGQANIEKTLTYWDKFWEKRIPATFFAPKAKVCFSATSRHFHQSEEEITAAHTVVL